MTGGKDPLAPGSVSVIGGGAAGLATAILLARDGHTVELFEQGDSLGGRIGSIERDGFRFDTGPSWYLMPEVYDHFFALAGTSAAAELDLRPLDPAYTVFSPSPTQRPITIPRGAAKVLSAFERVERGSGHALDDYLVSARRTRDLAIDYFLYNPFTSPGSVLHRDILGSLPTLTRLLTTSLERVAASTVNHPVLRQILQYPAIFLGTDPRRAPAIYHLMSSLDLEEGVDYPMGGFRSVVDALTRMAQRAGVRIHAEATVTRINTTAAPAKTATAAPTKTASDAPTKAAASHARGIRGRLPTRRANRRQVTGLTWTDSAGEVHEHRSQVVVSAADLHHTETRLLGREDQSFPEGWWQAVTSGPGAVLVFLGVEGKLPQLDHHSLFFTEDWASNFDDIFGSRQKIPSPASIYVCKPSHTDPSVAPAGHENLFILVPVPADAGLGAGGRDGHGDAVIERAADHAIDQVAQWADIPDLRDRIRVRQTQGPTDFSTNFNSWLGGMLGPAHTLRQSAMFRQQNVSKKVDGLYYAGATTSPGVGVPMCLISAELVLKHLRADSSPGPLPVPSEGEHGRGSALSSEQSPEPTDETATQEPSPRR